MPNLDANQVLADYRRATAYDKTHAEVSLKQATARLVAGEPIAMPQPTTTAGPTGSSSALKVVGTVGIAGVMVLVAWTLLGDREPADAVQAQAMQAAPVEAPVPAVAPTHALPPEPSPPTAEPSLAPALENGDEPESAERRQKRPRTRDKNEAAPATNPAPELDEEIRLMGEARRALSRGDARKALAALDEHERRFPRGQLRSDREGSAITALCQLGREQQAKARAKTAKRPWRGCP
jgi:type IV secretory pathway VirB10-like protein